jgi:hypothetical protein
MAKERMIQSKEKIKAQLKEWRRCHKDRHLQLFGTTFFTL